MGKRQLQEQYVECGEPGEPWPRLGGRALVTWIVLSTVLGRSFTALAPGLLDAQLFTYIGARWAAGAVPYLDIWDNKPPGLFLVTALASSVFPKSFLALAFVEGILILGLIGVVYAMVRQVAAPPRVAWLAAFSCATMSNLRYFNEGGTLTEIYTLFPAALSVFVFTKEIPRLRPWSMFAAGACAGISTSFKLVGAAPLLAQLTFLLLGYSLRRYLLRSVVFAAGALLAGFLFAWLPWMAYFVWKGGAGELLRASFLLPFLYGAESTAHIYHLPFVLFERLAPVAGVAVGAFAGIASLASAIYRTHRGERSDQWPEGPLVVFALWCLFDVMGALAGGRGYPHYFLAMSASLSVMAAIGYWHFVERWVDPKDSRRGGRFFVVGVMCASGILAQLGDLRDLRTVIQTPVRTDPIVAFVNAKKRPADTLFTWIYFPQLYRDTGLRSPHRLTSSLYLLDSPQMRRSVSEDLLSTLERSEPTFIVDGVHEEGTRSGVPDVLGPTYGRFRDLLGRRYDLLLEEGEGIRLYGKRR